MLTRFHDRSHQRGPGRDLTIDGRGSRVYDRLVPRLMRGFYRHVAGEIAAAAPDGAAILDAGTGPGHLMVELAAMRPDLRITGVDLSADMVAHAEHRIRAAGHADRIDVREGDVAALPFADATFDLAVSTYSMHHWADVPPAMAELARVLRPGGALWIYDIRTIRDQSLVAPVAAAFGGQPPLRSIPHVRGFPWRLAARWTVTRATAPQNR